MSRGQVVVTTGAALACLATACGGGVTAPDARYPGRAEGCEVHVYYEAPAVQTDNIGPVGARCSEDVSDAECVRTLMDEVCKLGGDVVWGVPEKPTHRDGKKRLTGRAAHTRAPEEPAAPRTLP